MKSYQLLNFISPKIIFGSFAALLLNACEQKPQSLPILGERDAVTRTINGKEVTDTIYHQIPDYAFLDQDSVLVSPKTFAGKVYVADFFFTTCPTICPKMKTQMLRIFEKYKNNPRVNLLSHSIDPTYDNVGVLRAFAKHLGVNDSKTWHFVTGDRNKIYEIGQKGYMVTAQEDKTAPGGQLHDGSFLLIDTQRRVRGRYDGTIPTEVDKLMKDIEILLQEK